MCSGGENKVMKRLSKSITSKPSIEENKQHERLNEANEHICVYISEIPPIARRSHPTNGIGAQPCVAAQPSATAKPACLMGFGPAPALILLPLVDEPLSNRARTATQP